jgi:hypothetical protein
MFGKQSTRGCRFGYFFAKMDGEATIDSAFDFSYYVCAPFHV